MNGNDGRQIISWATAYGILMNIRCCEISLVQKMNAVLLGVGSATAKRVCGSRSIICGLQLKYKFIHFFSLNAMRASHKINFPFFIVTVLKYFSMYTSNIIG